MYFNFWQIYIPVNKQESVLSLKLALCLNCLTHVYMCLFFGLFNCILKCLMRLIYTM